MKKKGKSPLSRRRFMGAPSDKLNIAAIGVGGRARANLQGVAHENIVALCDVDEERARNTIEKYAPAKTYRDFRVMLDEMEKDIDAVIVSTPDHSRKWSSSV